MQFHVSRHVRGTLCTMEQWNDPNIASLDAARGNREREFTAPHREESVGIEKLTFASPDYFYDGNRARSFYNRIRW